MTLAFVLSGGASLGAVEVGMLAALAEAGSAPDMIVGTSVGAVNGAWIAARPDADGIHELADVWRSLQRNDVFPTRLVTGLLGFLGRRSHLVPNSGLRQLLDEHLQFRRLEEAPIPFHVGVTDVLSGEDKLVSSGDAVDSILASAAIPGVFPPIRLGGRDVVDGGVVNNTPISHAVALGADKILVLPTGYACALPKAPGSALGIALHAITLTMNQRLALDVARYETVIDLQVIPPLCPLRVSPADFSHSSELIEAAHRSTREWISSRHAHAGQANLLAPHGH